MAAPRYGFPPNFFVALNPINTGKNANGALANMLIAVARPLNLVCDEVQKQLGISVDTSADDEKEEKKGNVLQRLVKLLSDIFVPIIPAIVAGGLLMGVNNIT